MRSWTTCQHTRHNDPHLGSKQQHGVVFHTDLQLLGEPERSPLRATTRIRVESSMAKHAAVTPNSSSPKTRTGPSPSRERPALAMPQPANRMI